MVTVPFLSSVPSRAQNVLVLRLSQSGTKAIREPGHSHPSEVPGLGTQAPCPNACWRVGYSQLHIPLGLRGCNELAGEAEATLRAKGECGLRFTGDAGCHSSSPSPDGRAPSSRGQGEGSHLPKGGFWLEVRNSSLGDFWEQSAKVG